MTTKNSCICLQALDQQVLQMDVEWTDISVMSLQLSYCSSSKTSYDADMSCKEQVTLR